MLYFSDLDQVAANNVPDGLRIVLKSDCGKGGDPIETNSCGEVELGTSVTFKVEVRATRCLEPGQTTFSISPVGLNQSMEVQVETLCKCGCEIPGKHIFGKISGIFLIKLQNLNKGEKM